MKIVINRCYGKFKLSPKALHLYSSKTGIKLTTAFDESSLDRTDVNLVYVVSKLGTTNASGSRSVLKVVEIPDDVLYTIESNNGMESIHEVHRIWK